jgi:hypothetical protein
MKVRNLGLLLLLGTALSVVSQAQIQHVQMRVEGMT